MSTSTAVPNNSMRQQLDELDTLLQRMLSLPINHLDEKAVVPPPPPPPPPPPRVAFVPPPAPRESQKWRPPGMVLLQDTGPVAMPTVTEQQPHEPAWAINLNPQFGSSVLAGNPPPTPVIHVEPPPPPPMRVEAPPPPPPSIPTPIPEPVTNFVPRRDEPPPPILVPFALFNAAFDGVANAFGPLGSWASRPAGRDLLGACGVLMLLGSVAWCLLEFNGWSW